tara:strand:+ start:386 stop:616 length:231 start_codon:yes stop_codon:yes gene_type:complete
MLATCSAFKAAPVIAHAACPATTTDQKEALAKALKATPTMYNAAAKTTHVEAIAHAKTAQATCVADAANKDYPCAC